MQPTFDAGDRVRTQSGAAATVIRPNRLDADKSVLWPDRWGQLPVNRTSGNGVCLRNDTFQRVTPPPPPPHRRRLPEPNPSLNPNIQPSGTPEGPTR